MKIYIDFDDVICETAKRFTELAEMLFGIRLPYDKVRFFNLQEAFGLTDAQYQEMMRVGHLPETLLSYEETKDAAQVIRGLCAAGHEVLVVTGRPYSAYEPSRQWLDEHGLAHVPLYCVDKYGRENFYKGCAFSMTLEELYRMDFDLAVEDSPAAFSHLTHFERCRVLVFDRPWNQTTDFPNERFERCKDWKEIQERIEALRMS